MDEEQLSELVTNEELERRFLAKILDAEDTERFLRTPAGRAMVSKAKADYMDALQALAEVSLDKDIDGAKALQSKAKVAEGIIRYLAEILIEGRTAADAVANMG